VAVEGVGVQKWLRGLIHDMFNRHFPTFARRGLVPRPFFSKGSFVLVFVWCLRFCQPLLLKAGVSEGMKGGWPLDVGRME
jgi:hypothetical protein